MIILVGMLTVGYAAVSIQLSLSGIASIEENEFKVRFIRSGLNGASRPSLMNKNGSMITFYTIDLTEVGEHYLSYEIANMSTHYDAEVQVSCSTDATNITIGETNEKVKVEAGKTISGSVSIVAAARENTDIRPASAKKLYDYIKELSKGLDTTIELNYGEPAKENGVYETKDTDSGASVYFYRGSVENSVIYANKCWNIVRTTETNGVKLLYAGTPVNGSCNPSNFLSSNTGHIGYSEYEDTSIYNLSNNIGYMHGPNDADLLYHSAHSNITDSEVKKMVDSWYEENIKGTKYENMLEDTVYCNNRSYTSGHIGNIGTALISYGYEDNIATLKCDNKHDGGITPEVDKFTINGNIGNGALRYPIGLITADEAAFAGLSISGTNKNTYLSQRSKSNNSIGYDIWTMTPRQGGPNNSKMAIIGKDYLLKEGLVDDLAAVVPMVSLNNDNYIISGDGSLDKPFVLYTKSANDDKVTCVLEAEAIERTSIGKEYDGFYTLYESVKMSSLGTVKENNIDYNVISSDNNGKGVYETKETDSGKSIYFYRGDVEDNNVIYADHCWQIVRTTETGGTKLIYNGKVNEEGVCKNTGTDKSIGMSKWSSSIGHNYMSSSSDSDVKRLIDLWYEEHIKDTKYESLLEDTVFCNDRKEETDFSNYTYKGWLDTSTKTIFQGTGRVGIVVGQTKPTLTCNQTSDRYTVNLTNGNGSLKYPIGLITADEAVYAGSTGGASGKGADANNYDYYLYVGSNHMWTMTPHRNQGTAIMLVAGSTGNIGNEVASSENVLVRPVVSIKEGVLIADGNGTEESPYILLEKNETAPPEDPDPFEGLPEEYKDNGIFSAYYLKAYEKLNTLSIDEKIGQLLLAHHNSSEVQPLVAINNYHVAGFTYFEADFTGKTERVIQSIISSEQSQSKIPLITAVDEEGGRVVRISPNTSLVSSEMSKYPNLFYTNINGKNAWKLSHDLYEEGGYSLIEQETKVKYAVLKRLGLNVNFGPVVDMAIPGAYISDRVIGLDAIGTAEYAKTVISASKETGVSSTMKHFPGYGNNEDTHQSGSVDTKTLEDFRKNDMVPFEEGIKAGGEAIMVSHNTVPAIDANNPSSLSKKLHDILRDDLKYTGIIFTDALEMGATENIQDKFIKAVKAGNNMILVKDCSVAFEELKNAVENGSLTEAEIDKLVFRTLAWKYYKRLM